MCTHRRLIDYTAREASWRRVFDPYAPLLLTVYHDLEQNLHFGLVETFFFCETHLLL